MSAKTVKLLIEKLPKDYASIVSKRLGISKKTVYWAIEKEKMDHPAIAEMITLAEEHQKKLSELQARIDRLGVPKSKTKPKPNFKNLNLTKPSKRQ